MSTATEPVLVEEMEKRIRRLERSYDQLLRKAETAEVSVRERVAKTTRAFEKKRDALRARLAEARDASTAAKDDLSTGIENAWNELSDALNKARAEFLELG